MCSGAYNGVCSASFGPSEPKQDSMLSREWSVCSISVRHTSKIARQFVQNFVVEFINIDVLLKTGFSVFEDMWWEEEVNGIVEVCSRCYECDILSISGAVFSDAIYECRQLQPSICGSSMLRIAVLRLKLRMPGHSADDFTDAAKVVVSPAPLTTGPACRKSPNPTNGIPIYSVFSRRSVGTWHQLPLTPACASTMPPSDGLSLFGVYALS